MVLVDIEGAFSKWMIDAKGRNNIPAYFSWYIRNARIRNESTTNRRWPKELINLAWAPVRQMHWNDTELLVIAGGILYTVLPTLTAHGSVWTAGQQYQMISQGKYTIILTGTSAPYVYSRTDGLFNSAVAWAWPWSWPNTLPYGGSPDPGIQNPSPLIWASVTWFTFIAGNQTSNNHILYISKPVLPDVPENAYSWSQTSLASSWWTGIEAQSEYDVGRNRIMTSEILAMESTLENVYVFCRETIEMIARNNVETFGTYYNLATIPIGDGDQVAWVDAVCTAWDKVFYITNSLQIKTIGYAQGIAYPQIGNLSDRRGQEIREFMKLNLNRDQSRSVAFFNKEDNTVEFHMRGIDSDWPNDITLVYDLIHDTFLVDTNKRYSCMTWGGTNWINVYAWDFTTSRVFEDYTQKKDTTSAWSVVPTPFEWNSPNIALWNPAHEKQFRGFSISGWMNVNTTLEITCYIDWREEFTKTITHDDIYVSEQQAVAIGGNEDNWPGEETLRPFEYVADQWMLRKKGKRIRVKVKASEPDMEFYLDSFSIDAKATGKFELNDKF